MASIGSYRDKRDSDGWMVPRVGTKSRVIYGLLRHGLSTVEIAKETGWNPGLVRVLAHKIRHRVNKQADIKLLCAALLWARNHVEVTSDAQIRKAVVDTLDRVLKNHDPVTITDMQQFRDLYPKR